MPIINIKIFICFHVNEVRPTLKYVIVWELNVIQVVALYFVNQWKSRPISDKYSKNTKIKFQVMHLFIMVSFVIIWISIYITLNSITYTLLLRFFFYNKQYLYTNWKFESPGEDVWLSTKTGSDQTPIDPFIIIPFYLILHYVSIFALTCILVPLFEY